MIQSLAAEEVVCHVVTGHNPAPCSSAPPQRNTRQSHDWAIPQPAEISQPLVLPWTPKQPEHHC